MSLARSAGVGGLAAVAQRGNALRPLFQYARKTSPSPGGETQQQVARGLV